MEVLTLLVADYASVDGITGKLNIMGAFRRIFAPAFPAVHKSMFLVIKLGGELGDDRIQHNLGITLTDADGGVLFQVSGPFDFPKAPPGFQPEHNVLVELQGLPFPKPGTYTINVTVDDDLVRHTDIVLVERPSGQE